MKMLYSKITHQTNNNKSFAVGVILQSETEIGYKLSGKGLSDESYNKWKVFFESEIMGPPVPNYQPSKTSPDFLKHLQIICDDSRKIGPCSIYISDATDWLPNPDQTFEQSLDQLWTSVSANTVPKALQRWMKLNSIAPHQTWGSFALEMLSDIICEEDHCLETLFDDNPELVRCVFNWVAHHKHDIEWIRRFNSGIPTLNSAK